MPTRGFFWCFHQHQIFTGLILRQPYLQDTKPPMSLGFLAVSPWCWPRAVLDFFMALLKESPEDSAKRYSFEREVISNHSVLCSCCYTLKFLVILNNVVLNNLEHKGSQLLVSPMCWEAEKGGPRMWSQHGLQRNHALKNHSGRSAGNLEDGLLLSQSNSPASQVPTTPTLKPEGMWYWLWV